MHESSRVRPVVVFGLTFGIWVTSLAIGLGCRSWLVRGAMVVPLTLASAQLFTIGHDAAHGSFSGSALANAVMGRLALLPSVHVFGLWRAHHEVHHRYTNLRGHDFVWTPLSVSEYQALRWWQRALHRIYRHRSGIGLGLHYAIEIWGPRMLWPRRRHDLLQPQRLRADAMLLYAMVMGLAASAWGFVALVDAGRAGDLRFWASAVVLLLVVPLLGTQWLIGFVIYLNHTHPDVAWYEDPGEWSRHQVQLEGAVGVRFPRVRQVVLPQRIMNHTAHHVHPGVPLAELKQAQDHLVGTYPDRIVSYEWSPKTFCNVLSRCKLYDYDTRRWLTYATVEDHT